ncbi:MAG: prolyl oligopeptidase family serine peptidase [Kiritimatiellia bacterium]
MKQRKICIFSAALVFATVFSVCGEVNEVYQWALNITEQRIYTNAEGNTLPYRFHAPAKLEADKKYPLVILFHGAGSRGTNNCSQINHGGKEILAYTEKTGEEIFFIAPQCPEKMQWVDTPWSLMAHKMPAKPSENMGLAIELITKMFKEQPINRSRVCVTGISMGGYATWDIVQRHPEWFATAMPLCGGGDATLAWKIRNVSIWAFHGSIDSVVPTARSRAMVAALWQCDGKIRYREYPGFGHNCWTATYEDESVLAWFLGGK